MPDRDFDRIARLAERIFDAPLARVSLGDREAEVTELDARFHASAPLRTSDGRELGTLDVFDSEPRELSGRERAILDELAALVVDQIELLHAARDEAERSTRARADFVVTAAHELRTPLAAVYGAAKLLGQGALRDERERDKLLTVIAEEAERLSVVVGEILTGAQLDAGHLEIVSDRLDPNVLAAGSIAAAGAHLPENLSLAFAAGEVPPIESDGVRIRQILASLIDNAVKYSPDGGRIEIAVEPLDSGVRFRISDEGIGVPAGESERIFERFTRLDANRTGGVGGTGLGLYIARELAGLLGGTLTSVPQAGRGSTFVLDLPASASG